jgi:hypothetical protein
MVSTNVAVLSQPEAFGVTKEKVPDCVYACPFQVKPLHALIVVVDDEGAPTVSSRVAMLSQPSALVAEYAYVPLSV